MGEEESLDKQLALKTAGKGEVKEKVVVKRNRPKERITILVMLLVTILVSFGFWFWSQVQSGFKGETKVIEQKKSESTVDKKGGSWLGPAEFEF